MKELGFIAISYGNEKVFVHYTQLYKKSDLKWYWNDIQINETSEDLLRMINQIN